MNVGTLFIMVIVLGLLGAFIGGLLVEYTLEFWLSRIADEPVDVSYGWCAVAGFFIGWNIGIPAAFITWICSMALD